MYFKRQYGEQLPDVGHFMGGPWIADKTAIESREDLNHENQVRQTEAEQSSQHSVVPPSVSVRHVSTPQAKPGS